MTHNKIVAKLLLMLVCLLNLSACNLDSFTLTTSFTTTKLIPEGSFVYFDEQQIGKVSEVDVSDGQTNVVLNIDKTVAATIGSGAAVFLTHQGGETRLEIYDRRNAEKNTLVNGQAVQGIDSVFQLGAWIVGSTLQEGSSSVTEFIESFDDYLQSDKFENDKNVIREQITTATDAATLAGQNIELEINKIIEELERSSQSYNEPQTQSEATAD